MLWPLKIVKENRPKESEVNVSEKSAARVTVSLTCDKRAKL